MGSVTKITSLMILSFITAKATADDAANAKATTQQAQESSAKTNSQTAGAGNNAQNIGSLAAGGYGLVGGGTTATTIGAGTTLTTGTITSGTISVAHVSYTVTAANPIVLTPITTTGGAGGGTVTMTGVSQGSNTIATVSQGEVSAVTEVGGTGLPTGASTGTIALGAAIGAIAGYYIGKWIAQSTGMTPGQTSSFVGWMMGAGAAGVTAGIMMYSLATAGTLCATVFGCVLGIAIIIIGNSYAVYSMYFTGKDNDYYILQYNCEPWQPPIQGDCSVCNKDVRTCSENRCRSLGQNCKYYNDNGEPGTCASVSGTWSAKITPWQEALTTGDSYTEIKTTSFRITGTENGKVEAWKQLQFGITTDKPATCRIDTKHTKTFDEMAVSMAIDTSGCESETGNCAVSQGINHKIVLSEQLGANTGANSGDSTIGMAEGDNNYYIRCKNFAGQVNDAEFAVKVVVAPGPDLTPPYIKSFSPLNGAYLSKGTNSTNLLMYVDEPSECRYSTQNNLAFNDMTQNMSCMTDLSYSRLGNLPCYTILDNLNIGLNKFYFKCKDKPGSEERKASEIRITNENAKEYALNVCSKGLEITSISSSGKVISSKSPVAIKLEAETSGCVDGGKATCYYQFGANNKIAFLNTGGLKHSQELTNMPAGTQNITIICQDAAGNTASSSILIKVELDNSPPKIVRFFQASDKLEVVTDEDSICKYTSDKNTGCSFDFDSDNVSIMLDSGKIHLAPWIRNSDYYIKCEDGFGNQNLNCGAVIKTY